MIKVVKVHKQFSLAIYTNVYCVTCKTSPLYVELRRCNASVSRISLKFKDKKHKYYKLIEQLFAKIFLKRMYGSIIKDEKRILVKVDLFQQ